MEDDLPKPATCSDGTGDGAGIETRLFIPSSPAIVALLSVVPENFLELTRLINRLGQIGSRNDNESFYEPLGKAIQRFTQFMQERLGESHWSFYQSLLPAIVGWAREFEVLEGGVVALSVKGVEGKVELSSWQARHVLANAFLLNNKSVGLEFHFKERYFGSLDFAEIYRHPNQLCEERILCQLSYFAQAHLVPLSIISFERYIIPPTSEDPTHPNGSPSWETDTTPLATHLVEIHTDSMEEPPATAFVDFANKDLHIGRIIPSLTQEEVLFSCCPELFVGLLFVERFEDNEVMIIRGANRFSTYSGYLMSFRWTGFYKPTEFKKQDVVVIDACLTGQFTKGNMYRDLNKAWKSFVASGGKISTGHWGCGAFGGDRTLKFIQQLCAATKAQVHLYYSTFKDEACKNHLLEILTLLHNNHTTISQAIEIARQYYLNKLFRSITFSDHVLAQLKIASSTNIPSTSVLSPISDTHPSTIPSSTPPPTSPDPTSTSPPSEISNNEI